MDTRSKTESPPLPPERALETVSLNKEDQKT